MIRLFRRIRFELAALASLLTAAGVVAGGYALDGYDVIEVLRWLSFYVTTAFTVILYVRHRT